MVIGVVGRSASGKDELLQYLHQRCDLPIISIGDVVREMARRRGIEPTRANLHSLSQEFFDRRGRDYFARKVIDRIEKRDEAAVGLSGIRTPTDVKVLHEHFREDFLLVGVVVGDPHTRFERARRRGSARDPEQYEVFRRRDREEEEVFHISDTLDCVDLKIWNDSSLEEFHEAVAERIIEPHLAGVINCRRAKVFL
ncbi:MAG: AAA family ATPase [Chloroflexota bacterium]|jgi:dephospho-CoA kinase